MDLSSSVLAMSGKESRQMGDIAKTWQAPKARKKK